LTPREARVAFFWGQREYAGDDSTNSSDSSVRRFMLYPRVPFSPMSGTFLKKMSMSEE